MQQKLIDIAKIMLLCTAVFFSTRAILTGDVVAALGKSALFFALTMSMSTMIALVRDSIE